MADEARTRIGVDLPPELHERLRAAYDDSPRSAAASLSEFVVKAILTHVAQLETEHNGGMPWPVVPAGILPRRRGPSGSKKERMMPRLSESQAGRIRGTAKALDITVNELCETAVRRLLDEHAVPSRATGEPSS